MKKIFISLFIICLLIMLGSNALFAATYTNIEDPYANETEQEEIIKETIRLFYNAQYDSYTSMMYKDISSFLDMSKIQNQNKVVALRELIERVAYIKHKGYVDINLVRLPLKFDFIEINVSNNTAEVAVNLVIDNNKAYPAFISAGINNFEMRKQYGKWIITDHDHNELFLFEQSKDYLIEMNEITNIHVEIDQLFANKDDIDNDTVGIMSLPAVTHYYNKSAAVNYAYSYANNPNTSQFYYLPSADCTNFVSQVLWKGFNEKMVNSSSYTVGWWAGKGGGSRNWENVSYFWSYMTGYKNIDTPGPRVNIVSSASSLDIGGVMQIDFDNNGLFNHSVVLVDKSTMTFAQHTSNGFRELWQYSGTKRFFNPSYFREILY